MGDLTLSVIATRNPSDVTVQAVLTAVRSRLASIVGVEEARVSLRFGLAALTEHGVSRGLAPNDPFGWVDDLEVFDLEPRLDGKVKSSLSVRYGCLHWDQMLSSTLDDDLATLVGKERATAIRQLDCVWWFDVSFDFPWHAELGEALVLAIAERCDGLVSESDSEQIFPSPEDFVAFWRARPRVAPI